MMRSSTTIEGRLDDLAIALTGNTWNFKAAIDNLVEVRICFDNFWSQINSPNLDESFEPRPLAQFEFESWIVPDNRRVFHTKAGYIGLGPKVMKEGDLCCILFGGPTAFILRPAGKPGEFLLVGGCCISCRFEERSD